MSQAAAARTIAFFYGFRLGVGGVESHLLSLVAHGTRADFNWLFVGPAEDGFRRRAEELGARVIDWQGPRSRLDPRGVLELVRILRRNRVDLVHVHSPRWRFQLLTAARVLGLPVVATIHLPSRHLVARGHRAAAVRLWLNRLAERAALRYLVACTVFVSTRVREEYLAEGLAARLRTLVIPNGIDPMRFQGGGQGAELRRRLGVSEGAVVACFVGRLDEQKGLDTLLAALKELPLERLGLCVWLVGEGPLRAALEETVRTAALGGHVTFLSDRSDVPEVLAASDLFVLPSRYEAMPVSLLEAMAAGIPCVATDVGDVSLLVDDGVSGLVVPPGDVRALGAALRRLTVDSELRRTMGGEARKKSARFTITAMVKATESVYRSTLGERSAEAGT